MRKGVLMEEERSIYDVGTMFAYEEKRGTYNMYHTMMNTFLSLLGR